MGYFAAQICISITHDANHGAYSNVNWLGYLMGSVLDLVGASSFMWRQQHVVGHHSFTNVENYDPDIRVKDPDVRRVTYKQPIKDYHSFQHLYLGALYGLLGLKAVLVDDFVAFITGYIGPVKIPKMTTDWSIYWRQDTVHHIHVCTSLIFQPSQCVSLCSSLYSFAGYPWMDVSFAIPGSSCCSRSFFPSRRFKW